MLDEINEELSDFEDIIQKAFEQIGNEKQEMI